MPNESGSLPGESADPVDDDAAFDSLLRAVAEAPRLPAEVMRTLTFEPTQGMPSVLVPRASALPAVGDVVDGRYQILGELGRGGMGVVFAGKNLRTQREVALKWLLPRLFVRKELEHRESVERFVREARAVSRVDHPNVVRVLDVGGDPDTPYLVMERLHGETLRERIKRGHLSWDEALTLLLPVMQGIEAAHRVGVVHRDLKPDNVFVCADGARVLDFGVSRIRGAEDHTTLTRTGTMLGTPAYMPLEQLRGSRSVDERTDIYALGVILFEALSGRLPFESQTPADQAVLLATQPPASLREYCPELAAARAEAVMKALGRDPSDRYPSVQALMLALKQAGKETKSRRAPLLVLGVALLAACALTWALLAARTPPEAQARPAPQTASATKPSAEPAPPVPPAAELESPPTNIAPPVANSTTPPAQPASVRPSVARPALAPAAPRSEPTPPPRASSTSLSVEDFRPEEHAPSESEAKPAGAKAKKSKPALDRSEF